MADDKCFFGLSAVQAESRGGDRLKNSAGIILIVDDDKFGRHALERQLRGEGCVTVLASSGQDALDLIDENPPDLVLLDALMPGLSGFEVLARLKADERTCNIPVVMITGLDDQDSRLKALSSGADEFLAKPVHRQELLIRVRNLLKIKRFQDALAHESLVFKAESDEKTVRLSALQEQLLQSEKLASIGQLAAGVAHEINNPIGFVNSNFNTLRGYIEKFIGLLGRYEALESHLPSNIVTALQAFKAEIELDYLKEDALQLLNESQDGVARVCKIVQDLKDFSRSDRQQTWEYADLHHCLDATLTIVNNEIKYKADVVKEYGEIPEIECLPSQLNQVFLNLLVNAAQAISANERGRISVRTGCHADEVWVEIGDTGSGITPDDLKHIFEPFYTTKPLGIGTGLGLSVSYGVINRHGGRIEVDSVLGRGTTMRVLLPIHQSSRLLEKKDVTEEGGSDAE